jgi:CDP-glucose 4,6-dehydratase
MPGMQGGLNGKSGNHVMTNFFSDQYRNKTVLLTGHSGFKGSWLAYWLQQLGATVIGYSLSAPTEPNHHDLLQLPIINYVGDINRVDDMRAIFTKHQPDIIFHLAAQPLVRQSYKHPLETIETNVLGTAKVLDCVRQTASVRAVIVVTSDKCYENPEDGSPLLETDPMGGFDPYSMSKGAAELVVSSYRNSFFNLRHYGQTHQTLIASVRAGNVIGGGDWAADRLIPDLIRGSISGKPVAIRNPMAVRPWQHVLEPLSGYLLVGQRLLEGSIAAAEGWNFGPEPSDVLPVREIVKIAQTHWSAIRADEQTSNQNPHEANLLSLDCTKAHQQLSWYPIWNTDNTIERTVKWYQAFYEQNKLETAADLTTYIQQATAANAVWTQ